MSALIPLATLPLLVTIVTTEGDQAVDTDMPISDVATIDENADTGQQTTSTDSGWAPSWQAAQRVAIDSNVPLVVHFGATWCGACRRMDAQVLNKSEVVSLLGQKVIGVRLDADQHRSLIKEYRVNTLPTDVIVMPDGTEKARYVGAVSVATYVSRLESLANQSAKPDVVPEDREETGDSQSKKTRSCLIVRRDGKMVGLGGFSPVALQRNRQWHRGSEEFVAHYQGVDYFLQSAEEVSEFESRPEYFIPHLHGCDPVELYKNRKALAGVIEFGSIYKGELFFFASLENRRRFQSNPRWYLQSDSDVQPEDLLETIR